MSSLTPENILLVDDSRAIRRILARTLIEAGYGVIEAADGEEGLEKARRELPDLILLDVDMPVLDGLSTMKKLQENPRTASIPVLFLTARTSGADAAAGLQLGARDYLRKPCDPEELLARVAGALAMRKAHADLQSQTQQLQDLSTTDPLTGLGNRRRFEVWLADERSRDGAGQPLAVFLVDVDHFKKVNDTHGHLIGDTVLRILARRLRSAVGEESLMVRWGGEEFLVISPGDHTDNLARTGERLRAAVATEPMAVGVDQLLWVTVSVGCAPGTVGAVMPTIDAADEAMYAAKQAGRNCVIVA